jgi:hypothetical protein
MILWLKPPNSRINVAKNPINVKYYVNFFFRIHQLSVIMKAEEKEQKEKIKLQFAAGLFKALRESGVESYRRLAKNAGMEPAHMQRISVGNLDLTLTTSIAIANALGMTFAELAAYFDSITEEELEEFRIYLDSHQKLRGKNEKLPSTKPKRLKKNPR